MAAEDRKRKASRPRSKSLVRARKRREAESSQGIGFRGADAAKPSSGFYSASVESFEEYYKKQGIVPIDEWDAFSTVLREPLPITFRFNTSKFAAEAVQAAKDEGAELLYPSSTVRDDFGDVVSPPTSLEWVDGWQLSIERTALRRAKVDYLQELRQWLIRNTKSGVITRQELVSMVPAAVLKVEPSHLVLDLCAAPGSKTTQLLELLHRSEPSPDACVVANDSDPVRAYTLSARCGALGQLCSRLVVAVHPAQRFPSIPAAAAAASSTPEDSSSPARYPPGGFHRVLCDVPCSGDGTLRKNPEVWKRWGPGLAIKHHSIQVQIALRGAALLQVGGLMTYSTCSLSPIEDEASVAEILRRARGSLELVEIHDILPGLKSSTGMSTWHVCDEGMSQWFSDYQASQERTVPRMVRNSFRKSMWPPTADEAKAMKLDRCIRILPHHQDCGGFFVALLRKTAPLPGPEPLRAGLRTTESHPVASLDSRTPKGCSIYSHMDYQRVDSKTSAVLKDSLGLKETFSSQLACHLWHRSPSSQKSPRRIWMIPSDVSQRLCTRVNTVSAGILAFVRRQYSQDYESTTSSGSSGWELTADGARLVLPHVNKKRGRFITVQAEDIELLNAALGKPVAASQLSSATGKAAKVLGPGPCILSLPSHRRESAPAHAGIIIMASPDSVTDGNNATGGAMILIRKDCNKQGHQSLLANHGD